MRISIQGFSDFERMGLASFFRLADTRTSPYLQVETLADSDMVVANADDPATLAAIEAAGLLNDTVFIGSDPHPGAAGWLRRPIDPVHVLRELDTLALRRQQPALAWPTAHAEDLLPSHLPTPAKPLAEETIPGALSQGGEGRAVLVVDDSPIARKFLAERLTGYGYNVFVASTAEQALEMVTAQAFFVVFLDIDLGPDSGLDGFQVCKTIKLQPRVLDGQSPAVVLVTGDTSPSTRVRGSLAGCDAYLTKPLLEEVFLEALRRVDPLFPSAHETRVA